MPVAPAQIVQATTPKKESKIQTKAKNQLILDKAIEQEFQATLEVMDVFVENIGKVSPAILKEKAGIESG